MTNLSCYYSLLARDLAMKVLAVFSEAATPGYNFFPMPDRQPGLDEAAALIQSAIDRAQEGRWISVKERLPRDDGPYLVMCPIGIKIAVMDNESECWDDEDGDDYWRDLTGYVTHWQPLPPPPKEEP